MKYKYNNKETIIKQETCDTYLLIAKGAKYKFVINKTGKEVYDLLKKYDDVNDIVYEIHKYYTNIDENVLKTDIYEILKCFEIYNLIELNDEEYNKINGLHCYFNGDLHYKNVNKFIISELDNNSIKLCPHNNIYYSIMLMRMRQMQNQEYQVIVQNDNKIVSYASFSCNPINISKVLTINDFIFAESLTRNKIDHYFKLMIEKAYNIFNQYSEIVKIRIGCNSTTYNDLSIKLLKDYGFKESVHLYNETINGDLYFFDYILKQ